jgi:hypothetical protein
MPAVNEAATKAEKPIDQMSAIMPPVKEDNS